MWENPSLYIVLALVISAFAALLIALKPGELSGFLVAILGALPGLGAYLLTAQGWRASPVAVTAGLLMPASVLGVALSLFLRSGVTRAASIPDSGEDQLAQPGKKADPEVAILADAKRYPLTSAILSVYPNHIVVFPTQGTIRENVSDILMKLFPPTTVTAIERDSAQREAQRDALLKEQLKKSIDSINSLGALSKLLAELSGKQIRFKGYITGDPKEAVARIIQRGGVFTFTAAADPKPATGDLPLPQQRHGSLLHTNGVEQLLQSAKVTGAAERGLLKSLRRAIQDYAFMTDALSIVGDRPAFLIYIGRSPEAHEDAIGKLLHRMDNPVFVPRTPPRLFDAVDPTEDVGGGSATYTLRLPRPCWWRQVGARDRENLKPNQTLDNMRWRFFKPNQVIQWEPSDLEFKDGGDRSVASYDIAVLVEQRVVVFRNQRLFLSPKSDDVERRAREYVKTRLGIHVKPADECVNVRAQQGKQFVGTLLYSSLAERVNPQMLGNDVEVCTTRDQFTAKCAKEDAAP